MAAFTAQVRTLDVLHTNVSIFATGPQSTEKIPGVGKQLKK